MTKILFATNNRGKINEAREILSGVTLLTPADLPVTLPEVPETADTFVGNAMLKAQSAAEVMLRVDRDIWVLSEDSGLEVDVLKGLPGVHSARFAGPHATDADRNRRLLEMLQGVPEEKRTARYRCVCVLLDPKNPDAPHVTQGTCEGRIAESPVGDGGFGYDPIFYVPSIQMTFGQAAAEVKHQLSHRGAALRLLATSL